MLQVDVALPLQRRQLARAREGVDGEGKQAAPAQGHVLAGHDRQELARPEVRLRFLRARVGALDAVRGVVRPHREVHAASAFWASRKSDWNGPPHQAPLRLPRERPAPTSPRSTVNPLAHDRVERRRRVPSSRPGSIDLIGGGAPIVGIAWASLVRSSATQRFPRPSRHSHQRLLYCSPSSPPSLRSRSPRASSGAIRAAHALALSKCSHPDREQQGPCLIDGSIGFHLRPRPIRARPLRVPLRLAVLVLQEPDGAGRLAAHLLALPRGLVEGRRRPRQASCRRTSDTLSPSRSAMALSIRFSSSVTRTFQVFVRSSMGRNVMHDALPVKATADRGPGTLLRGRSFAGAAYAALLGFFLRRGCGELRRRRRQTRRSRRLRRHARGPCAGRPRRCCRGPRQSAVDRPVAKRDLDARAPSVALAEALHGGTTGGPATGTGRRATSLSVRTASKAEASLSQAARQSWTVLRRSPFFLIRP